MAEISLSSPLVKIVLGDRADRSTWHVFDELQTTTGDMVRAEAELVKQKLEASKHSYQATCLAAYFALKEQGLISGGPGAFLAQLIDIDVLNEDEDEDGELEGVGPTQPAPEDG